MIRIKDIKLEVTPYGQKYDFDGFVGHLLYPSFGSSEMQCYVQRKLGPLPKWSGDLSINRNKEGILTSVRNGRARIIYEDAFFYFQSLGYFVDDKEVNEAYLSWFSEKDFPNPEENPEGFVLRLVELYPQLKPFIEII